MVAGWLANLLSVDCVRSRVPIISRHNGEEAEAFGNLINTKFRAQSSQSRGGKGGLRIGERIGDGIS